MNRTYGSVEASSYERCSGIRASDYRNGEHPVSNPNICPLLKGVTYVSRDDLVLRQDAINLSTQTGVLDVVVDIARNVVESEVGAHAIAHLPMLNVLANRDDFPRHIRARYDVVLLLQRVCAQGDDQVAVLYKSRNEWSSSVSVSRSRDVR